MSLRFGLHWAPGLTPIKSEIRRWLCKERKPAFSMAEGIACADEGKYAPPAFYTQHAKPTVLMDGLVSMR